MRLPMRVWDLPVRLIHWLIVLFMAGSYITYTLHRTQLHVWIGEATLALLLYRIVWGFVGSDTARFASFLRSPLTGLRHLAAFNKVEPDNQVGHNEAGGWMVVILLALIAAQVGTGLFIRNRRSGIGGPLFHDIDPATAHTLAQLHGLLFNVLLGAAILHVVAVAAYFLVKKQNLIRPMITGKKRLPAATRAPRMAGAARALAVLALVGLAMAALVFAT
jgi:cytochrome b